MDAEERRSEILHHLSMEGSDTMTNMAQAFNVSVRTIYRDIDALSRTYPIRCIRGRYGGGVVYEKESVRLSERHRILLERLSKGLNKQDSRTMQEIMWTLAQVCGW